MMFAKIHPKMNAERRLRRGVWCAPAAAVSVSLLNDLPVRGISPPVYFTDLFT